MKKISSLLVLCTVLLSISACGTTSDNKSLTKEVTTTTNTNINEEGSTQFTTNEDVPSENNREIITDAFSDIEYLSEDNIFILTTDYGNRYAVTTNGNAHYLSGVTLKSHYLKVFDDAILNAYGDDVTSKFISDTNTESLLGICEYEDDYSVWTLKDEETPTNSKLVLTGYDYDGNVLLSIDSDDYSFISENSLPTYLGENIFCFGSSGGYPRYIVNCINIDTKDHFSFTMETGDKFNNGYIIDQNNHDILNTKGEITYEDDEKLKNDIHDVDEGMFINFQSGKFYNINDLSLAIDLSEYKFVGVSSGFNNIDWEKTKDGAFMFIDGYCGIRIQNDNKNFFFGVIDTSGNWVMEPEQVDSFYGSSCSYYGKLADDLLDVNGKVFSIKSKEFSENPVKPKYLTKSTNIDGVAYYIDDDGYFCSYDYSKNERNTIEVSIDN